MNSWYLQLDRPPLTPPSWVFTPVWTVLYIMIALAIILYVWRTKDLRPYRVYGLILLHLIFNFSWTGIFFGLQKPGWALVNILLLDITLVFIVKIFWQTYKISSILLWPYLVWVFFATYLNAGFFLLN